MNPDEESTAVFLLMSLVDAGLVPHSGFTVKRHSLLDRFAVAQGWRCTDLVDESRDDLPVIGHFYDASIGRFPFTLIVSRR